MATYSYRHNTTNYYWHREQCTMNKGGCYTTIGLRMCFNNHNYVYREE